ncbi:LLM class F420-dependent oxidoreductase [Amycolatopsis pithecellobii]|uniref:TIGR03620 family F420-dependent LLM class oxidoreductase n=1 Tax=Amycolatopsis pithecellobii TaxID=664692 RepID=A0A6N7Z2W9_9PSEU|nr:LLM class F420-dependent oxidoreductase [Amycolatopsis pithecellobii]MTD54330.1 TIGR03620 family F420-dependent LLM class oxidoreductase [Amycolatopsis pithecellobii]
MTKPDLGRYGVFGVGAPAPQQAKEIEALGYGAVWVAGSPPAELDWAEGLLDATTTLRVATGIVNIWSTDPAAVAESFHRIEKAHPGRFLLGIGAGHPELDQRYRKPLDALTEYLDRLDEHGVPRDRRVVAALGPKLLRITADRAAGTHPYLTTPEHTALAREIMGRDAFVAPEHKVVLTTDVRAARAIGRKSFETSIRKTNYRNSWKRLGFTEEDLAGGGSERLVDSVVAHGNAEAVAARLGDFFAAGADHIPLQVLGSDDKLSVLAELAPALGLGS